MWASDGRSRQTAEEDFGTKVFAAIWYSRTEAVKAEWTESAGRSTQLLFAKRPAAAQLL